jgi:hypothetical protein
MPGDIKIRRKKGIFCLEGMWDPDLAYRSSVLPILELLQLRERIPFIHRDCATSDELKLYLDRWTLQKYRRYPILYLAFHGQPNLIYVGREEFTLDDFAEFFAGRCKRKMVIFGTCSTLRVDKRHLKRFLAATGAVAVCGYNTDVDWITSTAFEMMLLADAGERLQRQGPAVDQAQGDRSGAAVRHGTRSAWSPLVASAGPSASAEAYRRG